MQSIALPVLKIALLWAAFMALTHGSILFGIILFIFGLLSPWGKKELKELEDSENAAREERLEREKQDDEAAKRVDE